MDNDPLYLPDDEAFLPNEDLSVLLSEGASASVTELCSHGPSAALLLGCMLLAAAGLLVCIQAAWKAYAPDITEFYKEAAAAGGSDNLPLSFPTTTGQKSVGGSGGFVNGEAVVPPDASEAQLRQRAAAAPEENSQGSPAKKLSAPSS
ncbi:unnamed protein product [Polarella glacialis]|uniref:Uncharacterized protein n=1 Tax=Polarella glacialis TaxID=89957 RepID=A0A813IWG2_POLGL|nr:unnamed protein product [Polarella glacialis]CAE8589506.1 unnamed protein product [Polarella glacialis]CAE8657806.1 unnamed protein product [Polarella glacialis]